MKNPIKIVFDLLEKGLGRLFESAEIRDGVIHCPCGHSEPYGKHRHSFKCTECRRSFTSDTGLGMPPRCRCICKEHTVHYGGPM
jgi:hypothetical protein